MAWDPTFPQSSSIISGSPPQIQANWSYIQTTMQVDHLFANATPSNDGHHNVIQMPSQSVIPTISAPMRVATYAATSSSQDVPRFVNSGIQAAASDYHYIYGERGSVAIAGGTGVVNLVDFTGKPPVFGTFSMYDLVNVTLGITGLFTWDGINVNVQVTYSGRGAVAGNSTSWINLTSATTFLQLNRDHVTARTGKWQYFATPYQS
jgi:hypothetical protein